MRGSLCLHSRPQVMVSRLQRRSARDAIALPGKGLPTVRVSVQTVPILLGSHLENILDQSRQYLIPPPARKPDRSQFNVVRIWLKCSNRAGSGAAMDIDEEDGLRRRRRLSHTHTRRIINTLRLGGGKLDRVQVVSCGSLSPIRYALGHDVNTPIYNVRVAPAPGYVPPLQNRPLHRGEMEWRVCSVEIWSEGEVRRDKIHFIQVYNDVTFSIRSEFIRHTLDDSASIADLQGNKRRIPHCQMLASTGTTANEQTSELASRQGEPGSIPGRVSGFPQVGNVPDDVAGGRVFSGISRSPFPFTPIFTSITLIGSQYFAASKEMKPGTASAIIVEWNGRPFWKACMRNATSHLRLGNGSRRTAKGKPRLVNQGYGAASEHTRCLSPFAEFMIWSLAAPEAADDGWTWSAWRELHVDFNVNGPLARGSSLPGKHIEHVGWEKRTDQRYEPHTKCMPEYSSTWTGQSVHECTEAKWRTFSQTGLREGLGTCLFLIGHFVLQEVAYWPSCQPASRLPGADWRTAFRHVAGVRGLEFVVTSGCLTLYSRLLCGLVLPDWPARPRRRVLQVSPAHSVACALHVLFFIYFSPTLLTADDLVEWPNHGPSSSSRPWSGVSWAALNIGVLRADEGEASELGAAPECKELERTGVRRENPPTSGIVRHDSRARKSGSDPAFTLVEGE
ncbi:hypothetical protein PR048_027155 [Dryococelus australis]|uniref:Uncharacterized protein n=1 Tax=Dryococelus australis TaxID=614101 RepID=A0ABQ9GGI9_9NEOP|nr:hypothetical protein PR048_027155 [Dryococelus australis]